MNENNIPQIEKGIPIPTITQDPGKWDFLSKMEVGDSVVITSEFFKNPAKWRNSVKERSYYSKGKFISRTIAEGAVRIWRIK